VANEFPGTPATGSGVRSRALRRPGIALLSSTRPCARRQSSWRAAAPGPEGSQDGDLKAVLAVAWLYWCRAQARPEGAAEEDMERSVGLFAPIFEIDPELLPPQLSALLAAQAAEENRSAAEPGDYGVPPLPGKR
jgi:hypothetical protein